MLALMLDPPLKDIALVSKFGGKVHAMQLTGEYDNRYLLQHLIKILNYWIVDRFTSMSANAQKLGTTCFVDNELAK